MADLLIRDIDPELKRMIKVRAKERDRSMSDEAKMLMRKALAQEARPPGPDEVGFGTLLRSMVDDVGGVELELPPRDAAERPVPDFS